MKFETLHDLFVNQLRDLYSAESQIIKALPKMIKHATTPALKAGLTAHLEETKGQLERLKEISAALGKKLSGHTCEATKGLVKEAAEWMEEDATDAVMDAGIIADGQRVEHYEISAYGTAHAYALALGDKQSASLLAATLKEEKAADEKLGKIALAVNKAALAPKSAMAGGSK